MLAAVLLVVSAEEVTAPSPLFGSYDLGIGVGSANLRRIVENSIADLVHGRANGMHVTMRGVPDAGLVVENVITRCAAGRRPPAVDDSLNPLLLKRGIVTDVGIVGIVVQDGLVRGSQDSIAGIRKPLGIIAGL